jgi:hypothetical protein
MLVPVEDAFQLFWHGNEVRAAKLDMKFGYGVIGGEDRIAV